MPKFVKRAVLLGIVLAVPHVAWGADREFPTLNSIGRFWGVGYTRGGYQAAQDGRFDIVVNRHPASNYRVGGLPQYSQPLNSLPPIGIASPSPVLAPSLAVEKAEDKESTPKKSGAKPVSPQVALPEVIAPPKPVVPTKPAEPPPRWLEDYLQQEAAEKANEIPQSTKSIQPNASAPEISPSDLFLEPAVKSDDAGIEPGKDVNLSIFDASSPIDSRPSRYQQVPSQSPVQRQAAPRVNRYR